jgi:hypothetical protein
VTLSRSIEGLLLQVGVESKKDQTVKVFAGLPQGVRAENLVDVEVI